MGSFLFDADNNLKVNVVVGASSGGLTDAQLRASAVPVSGAITVTLDAETTKVIGTVNQGTSPWVISGAVTTDALTDAQLRATPVPVSGDFTSDGLTNTELRASTVPVDFGITTIALLEDIRNELRMMREMLTHVVCESGDAYPKDFIDDRTVIE
jgi:hypothetical protein